MQKLKDSGVDLLLYRPTLQSLHFHEISCQVLNWQEMLATLLIHVNFF